MVPPERSDDPHADLTIEHAGALPKEAAAAAVLLHGRGGSAHGMLQFADTLSQPKMAYLAPQAPDHTWYPQSFLAPIKDNEPFLTSAIGAVDNIVRELMDAGHAPEKIVLIGFSQGACLSLEFAARHPRRYGGVAAFSGGLIGPKGHTFSYEGTLEQTPVFLGCSDRDPHIPLDRVQQSSNLFEDLGADVTERIYPNMGHTVNDDETAWVRELLLNLIE